MADDEERESTEIGSGIINFSALFEEKKLVGNEILFC